MTDGGPSQDPAELKRQLRSMRAVAQRLRRRVADLDSERARLADRLAKVERLAKVRQQNSLAEAFESGGLPHLVAEVQQAISDAGLPHLAEALPRQLLGLTPTKAAHDLQAARHFEPGAPLPFFSGVENALLDDFLVSPARRDAWLESPAPLDQRVVNAGLKAALALKHLDVAQQFAELVSEPDTARWELQELERLNTRASAPRLTGPGAIRLAVTTYGAVDRATSSTNLGDYIQTLAFLSHVARWDFSEHGLHGPDELVSFVGEIAGRLDPSRRLGRADVPVELVPVNRDDSREVDLLGQDVSMVAFGWHAHPLFDRCLEFPFAHSIDPVFLSFHINNPEMLDGEGARYLREHAPIGCRDWATVYLLRSHGIEAFFSGCVTMTVGELYPDKPEPAKAEPNKARVFAFVDVSPRPEDESSPHRIHLGQASESVRTSSLVENLRASDERLERYRKCHNVITSRLHCHLPVRSLGVATEHRHTSQGDVRFEGLIGIDDAAFSKQRGVLDRAFETVLGALFAGEGSGTARQQLREIAQAEIAGAADRSRPPATWASRGLSQRPNVQPSRRPHEGTAIAVATRLDRQSLLAARTSLRSMTQHATAPLHFTVFGRGLSRSDIDDLEEFSDAPIELIAIADDSLAPGLEVLLVPDFVEASRAVWTEPGTVAFADLLQLVSLELGRRPFAARPNAAAGRATLAAVLTGHEAIDAAARPLSIDRAGELRRWAFAQHRRHDYPTFSTGAMVLDLDRLRADSLTTEFVEAARQFRLDASTALAIYAGANRADLPAGWNHRPDLEFQEHPHLVHWAGSLKPWESDAAPRSDLWPGQPTLAQ